jgi:hypothetical protein
MAGDIAAAETGSWTVVGELMAIIFFMPIPLIMGLRAYRKGKKEEAETLLNGGDNYGE